jgi:hypothetical protein
MQIVPWLEVTYVSSNRDGDVDWDHRWHGLIINALNILETFCNVTYVSKRRSLLMSYTCPKRRCQGAITDNALPPMTANKHVIISRFIFSSLGTLPHASHVYLPNHQPNQCGHNQSRINISTQSHRHHPSPPQLILNSLHICVIQVSGTIYHLTTMLGHQWCRLERVYDRVSSSSLNDLNEHQIMHNRWHGANESHVIL